MNLLLVSLLFSLGAAPSASATAAPSDVPAEVRATVDTYLSTIDTRIPASRWKALGEPGVIALAQIARSKSTLPTRRARAVGAAGLIGGEQAKALARELMRPDAAPPVVRQSAVRALGQLLSASELTRALTPVLQKDPTLSVRAVAANVLTQHAPEACAAIGRQASVETAARRPAFSRALEQCAAKR